MRVESFHNYFINKCHFEKSSITNGEGSNVKKIVNGLIIYIDS